MTLELLYKISKTLIAWIEDIQFAQQQCARGGYYKVREIFHESDTLFNPAAKILWNTILVDKELNAAPPRVMATTRYSGAFTEETKKALLDEIKYYIPETEFVVERFHLAKAIEQNMGAIVTNVGVTNAGNPVLVHNFMFTATLRVSDDGKYYCLEIIPVVMK